MQKILIVTGGSKGIGCGIVLAYLQQGYRVFSIARTTNKSLEFQDVVQIQADISQIDGLDKVMEDLFQLVDKQQVECITLINNAATIGPVSRIENKKRSAIEHAMQVNVIAPFILTGAFIRATLDWPCVKKVINITSGAAKKAYFGMATYCATKAALDMMTRAVAIEQNTLQNGATIISISPGVVDTDMQAAIRSSDPSDFIEVERFRNNKTNGVLVDIEVIGNEIFSMEQSNTYENGAVINVEEWRTR